MLRKYSLLIVVVSMLALAACVPEPQYSFIPHIEFQSMSGNTFDELDEDSLSIVVYFEDGDGDLGSDDSINMFWEDSRVPGFPLAFKIPFIELQGNSKAISGTITTYYPISYCLDNDDAVDTFYYKIYIVDRAGNVSNVDSTDLIFLNCN